MFSTTTILIFVLAALLGLFVYVYNRTIGLIEAVNNNEKQITIQLDRRYKVFESLIQVVKKYMDYEKSTLAQVVELRNAAQNAQSKGDMAARSKAENQISSVLGGISAVFEQYPDLKANQNAMQLQEEIVSTENKLAFSKQAYNDSVETYNAFKKSLPQALVVSMLASLLDKPFEYWSLSEDDAKTKENYTVKL